MKGIRRLGPLYAGLMFSILVMSLPGAARSYVQNSQHRAFFHGAKANTGFVTHTREGNKNILTLSNDFTVPDTPDPHWQVVDSKGNVYLLQKITIKGDKVNTTITVPPYVQDVAKVQIWCAWAEVLLGEASFDMPVT